jgi:hypothetical protein
MTNRIKWIALAIVVTVGAALVSAQTWDRFNGSARMSAATSGSTPLVVVDQRGAGPIASFRAAGVEKWGVSNAGAVTSAGGTVSGNLIFSPDNTYDIGASGATRPKNIYAKGNVTIGDAVIISSPSDGVGLLRNAAGTDFARLQIGGTTSSFPSIKRNGPGLSIRAADDSADASITLADVIANNAAVTNGSGTGITVNTSGGTVRRSVYKVTVDRTAFIAAAVTADVTIVTLPAKTSLLSIYADLTQVFACSVTCTSSTLSMTLGSAAGGNTVLVSFDADAALAVFGDADAELGTDLTRATAVQGGKIYSFSSTQILSLRLTSGTGNIGTGAATNLSTGSITFYVVTERLP